MDQSCTICLTSTPFLLVVSLSLLISVSECYNKCSSSGKGCDCTGPGCITETGQVIGLICGILGGGIIILVTCLYCCLVGRRLPKCCKRHCCQTFNPNYEADMPTRPTFTLSRSQWDRNDVQITSSQDGFEATKYTLNWSVDDFYGDVPVMAFNLNFRRVEVMPDRVDGEYRLRYNLDLTDRNVDFLPPTTRTYTMTGLQPNSFYSIKLTAIYGNIHGQRKTNSFIFKTAEAQTEEQAYAAYLTHAYEDDVNPSVTNGRNGYPTESRHNYHRENLANSSDNRILDNSIGSRGYHGAVRMSDNDNNKTVFSYSDPPPSYYEATKTSNITETSI